ncbi:MAG: ABC transporter ATP-binding protein [Acidimicrobiia bacterium]|nr:ABC transporter ATP-binding protein [Acidimicrobiia bacterium]
MSTDVLAAVAAEPGVPKPNPILVVDDVRRTFGGLVAVDVRHLEVERGTITSLIGPNGAGKTTLFNCLTGFDRPQAGYWAFDGHRLEGRFAYQIPRYGLVRTFQLTKALDRLTVMENMLLASRGNRGERLLGALLRPSWRHTEDAARQRAERLLETFELTRMGHDLAGTLSGGQRKLLEMARALMTEPAAILLDEPMAGVNPRLRQTLCEHIEGLRDGGLTVFLIEHDMDVVMGISDWVVCMAEGNVISEGPPAVVRADPAVVDAYLGSHDGLAPVDERESHEDETS